MSDAEKSNDLCHERRNALSSIIGLSGSLLRDPTLSEKHRRTVGLIQQNGQRLLHLVEEPEAATTGNGKPATASPVVRLRAPPGACTPRMLVADDSPEGRMVLVDLLASVGFSVQEAANGEEAIAAWREYRPDMIWMDMRMPLLDGCGATRRIREEERRGERRRCVIIALTANALPEQHFGPLDAGCDDLVVKPFEEDDIFNIIEHRLGLEFERAPPPEERYAVHNERLRELFAALPAAVRVKLLVAADELDVEAVRSSLQEIASLNEELASALRGFADLYDFEAIRRLA